MSLLIMIRVIIPNEKIDNEQSIPQIT